MFESGKKSRTWIALLAVLGLFAAACGGSDSSGGDGGGESGGDGEAGAIWVLLPSSEGSDRWETDDRKFFTQALTDSGAEFNVVNAEGDPSTQQRQAEQAIASGAKVIVLTNLDSGSGSAIIASAHEAGVKVIDYDRLTIEGPGADAYISFDNVRVGETMAEVLEPAIDALGVDKPQIAMLNGGPTDNNSSLFKQGYNATVSARVDAGDWEVAADEDTPNWDNQEGLRIFEQVLVGAEGNIDAAFAANDGLANSIVAALKSAGHDPIPLSGQDATAGGIQNILSGWQTMTVYKTITGEVDAAVAVALAMLNGEDISAVTGEFAVTTINNGQADLPFYALTPVGVTVDNIADTVIADGFRTWEEICVGEFEEFCPADR